MKSFSLSLNLSFLPVVLVSGSFLMLRRQRDQRGVSVQSFYTDRKRQILCDHMISQQVTPGVAVPTSQNEDFHRSLTKYP